MGQKNVGMMFSRDFSGNAPLGHIISKFPVYQRLLEFCQAEGWKVYVLTRKTYIGDGIFKGVWRFENRKFSRILTPVKIDLVYDRSGGVKFPPADDNSLIWVNRRDFKVLAWDKWATYQVIGEYMPQTFIVEDRNKLSEILSQIKSNWVVLKPFNGLKGIGIFIGLKKEALKFKFDGKYNRYIAQEFVDTGRGIAGITPGMHDLRIVVVNGKPVWCHVRVPAEGSLLANAAQGGTLTEVDYDKVPESIKNVVGKVSKVFSSKYDNPIYSLDFGIGKGDTPYIFEINDQMGFPKWEMKNRDIFLNGLVANFKEKLACASDKVSLPSDGII
jgi:glutathione synthase/RimK-type ligase-like ATP-grasp enzyme